MADNKSRREILASLAKSTLIAAAVTPAAFSAESKASTDVAQYTVSFDMHQHLESQNDNYTAFNAASLIAKDFDLRTRIMDANGIEKSIIMIGTNYRRTNGIQDTRRVNDLMAEYVAKHSDRFPVAVGTVEINHGDASLKELERCAHDLKLRGAVWHHGHMGVPINSPFMRPILKTMQELKLLPFIHTAWAPFEMQWMLEELVEEFPQTTFVYMGLSTRMAKRYKNVLFVASHDFWPRSGKFETFIEQLGSDRLMFGSDTYAFWPSSQMIPKMVAGMITNSLLKPDEKTKILGRNGMRLFGL